LHRKKREAQQKTNLSPY